MNYQCLDEAISNRKVTILGFGREGKALLDWLLKHYPGQHFTVADGNPLIANQLQGIYSPERTTFITGEGYLESLQGSDLIVKTPGIPMKLLAHLDCDHVTSQTNLFLKAVGNRVIGITGTKGKSTTTSLIHAIMQLHNPHVLLTGNIGIPPFSVLDQVTEKSSIVMELSSHQLELTEHSPHTALLLNVFEEHLDHYSSYAEYQLAKFRIAQYQLSSDIFLYNADDLIVRNLVAQLLPPGKSIPFSLSPLSEGFFPEANQVVQRLNGVKKVVVSDVTVSKLRGIHNLGNIVAASAACFLNGVPEATISQGMAAFQPLEHRLEYVGVAGGISFYNDSISTIPEATLAALQSLGRVHTLLLGGFDRQIDYHKLLKINSKEVKMMLFTGEAGRRMMQLLALHHPDPPQMYFFATFDQMALFAFGHTPKGEVCLLSPAASSYDQFQNFEERGRKFKEMINSYFNEN